MKKCILTLLGILLCVLIAAGVYYGVKGYGMYKDAISDKSLSDQVEEIRSRDNFTTYSRLPGFYINAVISIEDHRFKKHGGIDPVAIGRALWIDLKTRSFEEGGSTITQQVAKNMFFTRDKTLERKAAEVFAALDLESEYNKEEIFELYVNTAYFGNGYTGIYEAAKGYYKKEPSELTDYEAAMLAGLPNAPSLYSPYANRELAVKRASRVLESMVENGVLSEDEAKGVMNEAGQ